ncbi:unnamed protein product, partial [marine sediment metagenome]
MRITLNISLEKLHNFDEINSIDEAVDIMEQSNRTPFTGTHYLITPEQEFWAHCSNLQTWAEHHYDTRLLHSNISFPLLRRLTEAGDPVAK